jgi:hypothetical protein
MELLSTPFNHPMVIVLAAIYGVSSCITTYDIRYIQATGQKHLPDNALAPPFWTGYFYYLMWATWSTLFLLNPFLALALFLIKFILKVIPVLEILGEEMIRPFSKPHNPDLYYTQIISALDDIREAEYSWNEKYHASYDLIRTSRLPKADKTILLSMADDLYNDSQADK